VSDHSHSRAVDTGQSAQQYVKLAPTVTEGVSQYLTSLLTTDSPSTSPLLLFLMIGTLDYCWSHRSNISTAWTTAWSPTVSTLCWLCHIHVQHTLLTLLTYCWAPLQWTYGKNSLQCQWQLLAYYFII